MEIQNLDEKLIENTLKNFINLGNILIILMVTFNNGDILIGRFDPHHRSFSENNLIPDNLWIKGYNEESKSIDTYKIEPLLLIYDNFTVEIPYHIISGLKLLNWKIESIPFRFHGDIDSPLLEIISKHNNKVSAENNLKTGMILFNALPTENLSLDGIALEYDEMIYADWEFISHLSGGTKGSIGISFGASVTLSPGRNLEKKAIDKIKNGTIEKVINFIFGSTFGEARVSGYLAMPEEEITTVIEGEECILALCCEKPEFNPQEKYIPVFLKKDSISYPKEYLPHIKSKLVFYGQVKQFPIDDQGISSKSVLMARAIGYLNKQP